MPELPEVETTAKGLQKVLPTLTITDVWSDLPLVKHNHRGTETLKDTAYFASFRRAIKGKKILRAERRAKNILIHLSGGKTILIHMKMTGHLLYGKYAYANGVWKPAVRGPLDDPFNRFLHVVFTLGNGKHLAFSDMRKFGKIVLIDTDALETSSHLAGLGPEPLSRSFTGSKFKAAILCRPNQKIKLALMDQSLVAGIGNIYSDEILWHAGVHPLEQVKNVPSTKWQSMFDAAKRVLAKGIDFGGDSTSDYRTIDGTPGKFHLHHEAYRRTGESCRKKDRGVILRIRLGGRSAHYCSAHQRLQK